MKWLRRAEAMENVKRQRVHFWMRLFHLLMEPRRRYWYWIRHHFTSNSSSATWNDSGKYYYFVTLLFSSQIANPFWLMGAIDFFLFSFAFAFNVSITIMVYWTTQIQYSFVYSSSVWSMTSAAYSKVMIIIMRLTAYGNNLTSVINILLINQCGLVFLKHVFRLFILHKCYYWWVPSFCKLARKFTEYLISKINIFNEQLF